jgi:hypothetical protein
MGLPSPELLREYSLRCREAAEFSGDVSRRRLLAHEAFMLAQLAEGVDRKNPAAVSLAQGAIERCESILRESEAPGANRPEGAPRQALDRDLALHRAGIWRQKAEECRAIAENMMFRDTRATYRRLASGYDTMAQHEEERAAGMETARSGSGDDAS